MPAFARATAIDHLENLGAGVSAIGLAKLASDPHPLVRASAATALRSRNAKQAARALGPLLDDPKRLVRIRAAQSLLGTPTTADDTQPAFRELTESQRGKLTTVLDELHDSLMATNDRAAAHLSWGVLLESYQDIDGAIEAYETAMRVEPTAIGPRANLAALLDRIAGSDRISAEQSKRLNRRVDQLRKEELPFLERDARLAPNFPDLQYRVGQVRYLSGDPAGAVDPIQRAIELSPQDHHYRLFFALLLQHLSRIPEAIHHAEELNRLRPGVAKFQQLLKELQEAENHPPQNSKSP